MSVTVRKGPHAWHNPDMSSVRTPLADLTIRPGDSILDALGAIEKGHARGAVVISGDSQLIGVVSDGDLRRALLAGYQLGDVVDNFVQPEPLTVSDRTSRADVLDLMRARDVSFVPILDEHGTVTGIHLLNEIIGPKTLPNAALIMAGGRGTRLGALTESVPKPLLKVADRPVIEWIILHLVSEGIRTFFVSTGYLADQIEHHLGDGSDFGCSITYLRDPADRPLGSGGALSLLTPYHLEHPIIALNGDLMTRFDLRAMLTSHRQIENDLTLASQTHSIEVPFGVLQLGPEGSVEQIDEKPNASWPVNAGIYVINPELLGLVRSDRDFPMTELIQSCLDAGHRVGHWEIDGDWIDIGRPEDLREARGTA